MNNPILLCFIVFGLTLLITVLIERRLIPFLKERAAQPIYAEGPSWHLSKSGTPTMGGVAFILACAISLSLSLLFIEDNLTITSVIVSLMYAIGNSLVGVFDDLMKLRKKKNSGLTPIQKLILQSLLAILFLMARRFYFNDQTTIDLGLFRLEMGFFYYPFASIILLGIVNCANLTDGIDGLATSTSATIGTAFLAIGVFSAAFDITIVSSALIGGALGFLIFNKHPARVFMGDTGSLFLGGMTVALGFSTGNPLTVVFIGGIYVIEGVSVILQVLYFKITKKRLFKMAPLHHHLEKCGFSENKICIISVLLTMILSAVSFLLLRK